MTETPDNTLEQIISDLLPDLVRYVRKCTMSVHDTEDIVQEALLSGYKALKEGTEPVSIRAWIFTIVHNQMINYHRKKGTISTMVEKLKSSMPQTSEHLSKEIDAELIANKVNSLPPTARETIILRYYHGFSYEEIADIMSVSVGTIKQQIFRSLKFLREQISHFDKGEKI